MEVNLRRAAVGVSGLPDLFLSHFTGGGLTLWCAAQVHTQRLTATHEEPKTSPLQGRNGSSEAHGTQTVHRFELTDRDHDVSSIKIPESLVDKLKSLCIVSNGSVILHLQESMLRKALRNGWSEVLQPHMGILPFSQLTFSIVEVRCMSKEGVVLDPEEGILVELCDPLPRVGSFTQAFTRPQESGRPVECTLKVLSGMVAASPNGGPDMFELVI